MQYLGLWSYTSQGFDNVTWFEFRYLPHPSTTTEYTVTRYKRLASVYLDYRPDRLSGLLDDYASVLSYFGKYKLNIRDKT